ncbi:MAG: transcriptional regulator [Mycobacteriaceae bacterium]|uniref:transcriptional regulator n=1 Tax=Corynebacterium sp. TaxID=1720 RepID=UPI003F9E32CE
MDEADFDRVIHQPLNLRICGLLRNVDEISFATVRETLEVSDATLSTRVRTLTEAGYVRTGKTSSKNRGDARRVMWMSLTKSGRDAFDAHVRALREILRRE